MRRYYLMAIMLIAGLSFSYSQVETHYLNSGEALKHINKPIRSMGIIKEMPSFDLAQLEKEDAEPSQSSKTLSSVTNSLITLTGKNCLPQIMPLTIQNATLHGTHYAIVKDVSCEKDVRSGTQGNVTFEQDSDYTFETKGTFELTKGVEIKLGAELTVVPSEISY